MQSCYYFHYLEALLCFEDVGLHFAVLRFTFHVRLYTPKCIAEKSDVTTFRTSSKDPIYQGVDNPFTQSAISFSW